MNNSSEIVEFCVISSRAIARIPGWVHPVRQPDSKHPDNPTNRLPQSRVGSFPQRHQRIANRRIDSTPEGLASAILVHVIGWERSDFDPVWD